MSKVDPEQTAWDIEEAARRLLIEQLEVQLAGCGVAALRHIQAPR